jgi:hypothetical protein
VIIARNAELLVIVGRGLGLCRLFFSENQRLIFFDTMASFLLTEHACVTRPTLRRSQNYETSKSWVYVN